MARPLERIWNEPGLDEILKEVRALVADARATCLWFLAEDFLPGTRAEALRALEWIVARGDREQFVRARRLQQWLSRTSSARSVDC